mmetsp:Transcript_8433/g.22927  ORF Transcript_8433/g.22927 Transcript_8433/m.22927 type:complete len:622 (-) Transcript_8433:97-1962(-)|eukprot:CAMPEP_0171175344 /NCGR_PEP_ID=MMETSP0790-20130122/11182_1 /TAXON_ID=2925 /ORGANISM="Alexandrium catenella, Strain OF101" /LENGTH=621 /DNA_ID=CAMNT_0011640221 /DNA_START=71 /DNA_END=1936 /DNA_ORIENTATION=+
MTNPDLDVAVDSTGGGAKKGALAGVPVTFTNLTYTVKVKKKPFEILSGISGHFQPGRFTALMGPSGSGKTTLMDIIAGRKTGAGKLEGEVLYGGSTVAKSSLKHLCGYVEQFDTLVGELTVQQMLMYTAELKLSRSLSREDKQQRVDEIIELLRLQKCRNTVIGNQLVRGISGGQAKRVNIALALITRPKVVFLDEPTSGLDSRMANEVCVLLKDLAREGATVIATVHSPTIFAFSLFDDLFMLQAGGRIIYSGAVADARAHFDAAGYPFPEDKGRSFPDWLVDTTSGHSEEELNSQPEQKQTDFAKVWEETKSSERSKAHADTIASLKASPMDAKSVPMQGPGQLHALRTLLAYRMSAHYKDGEFLGPRIGDKVFLSVLTMTIYWGIGDKPDAKSIQSTAAVLFFFTALCGYGAAAFVPSLTLERALFYRERADGCYTAVVYYVAKFIEEAVLCTITSLLFSLIVFFAMHLQGSFLVFAVSYFLTSMVGIVLAYAVAAFAPNMEAANALLPTYVTTCMYFGGLFIVFDKIPIGWYWYSWTSFLRFAWGALMLNQFDGQATGTLKLFYDDNGVPIDVLQFYALDTGMMNSLGFNLGLLAGICLIFGALGALFLTFVSHVKR